MENNPKYLDMKNTIKHRELDGKRGNIRGKHS
jgi:hypothetical protein